MNGPAFPPVHRDVNLASIRKYRRKAAAYDSTTGRTARLRVRTVAQLALRSGDVVVDAGCGTGLSLPLLLEQVGPSGRVIGIDQCPEMVALARRRVAEHGWQNVLLVEGPIQQVALPERFDAILFNYTHDICRCERAIANLFRNAKPGARVAIAGMKFFPWWAGPLNLYAYFKNLAWNGSASGMWTPWDIVARYVPDLRVQSTQIGMGYIGSGHYRDGPAAAA
jgi:ubiquinone/menaquinone biosynthesis C-methylase UbiE